MAEIKKILKNQIYGELKKLFNLKNCYIKVTYDNTDEGCQFHITVTIEQMNLSIRTCSVVSNELMSKESSICKDIVEDVKKSVSKAINSFVYR